MSTDVEKARRERVQMFYYSDISDMKLCESPGCIYRSGHDNDHVTEEYLKELHVKNTAIRDALIAARQQENNR